VISSQTTASTCEFWVKPCEFYLQVAYEGWTSPARWSADRGEETLAGGLLGVLRDGPFSAITRTSS
jgi:hypothetical protein